MSRCPDCDPVLVAGWITCPGCHARSYPAEAEWMPDASILATFATVHEACCARRREFGTVLLDLASDQTLPPVQRPRICRGTTTAGRPCRGLARPGSAYCHWHDPARQGAR